MVVELKAEEENLNDIEELTHDEEPIEDKSLMWRDKLQGQEGTLKKTVKSRKRVLID